MNVPRPHRTHEQIRAHAEDVAAFDLAHRVQVPLSPAGRMVLDVLQLLREIDALQARVDTLGKWLGDGGEA